MKRTNRRAVASLVLVLYLIVYIYIAYTIGSYLAVAPRLLTLFYFVVAGFAWIIPLKPLFAWMNSGPED